MAVGVQTVQVLLAAYNGEKYLRQQLKSILGQRGVSVRILVRDDGSTDGTAALLRAYERKYGNLSVYSGERKGSAGSFFDLLRHADLDCRYFAFADQDDVWMADKLRRAVLLLEGEACGQPLLYAGKVFCTAKDLGGRQMFAYRIGRAASFGNALMENICMGCTEVFNRNLLELVREHMPRTHVMHDWWMYLTASYFGKVIYDQQAFVLYRQHGNNQIGMQNDWIRRWAGRMRRIGQMKHRLSGQAVEFQRAYAGLIKGRQCLAYLAKDRCLELMCGRNNGLRARLRIFRESCLYRQNALDDIVCRVLFAAGFL